METNNENETPEDVPLKRIKLEPLDDPDEETSRSADIDVSLYCISRGYPPIFYNSKYCPSGVIDTEQLVKDVFETLNKLKIPISFMSDFLRLSEGTLLSIIQNPRQWQEMSVTGRIPYVRMFKWIQENDEMKVKLMRMVPEAANDYLGMTAPQQETPSIREEVIKVNRTSNKENETKTSNGIDSTVVMDREKEDVSKVSVNEEKEDKSSNNLLPAPNVSSLKPPRLVLPSLKRNYRPIISPNLAKLANDLLKTLASFGVSIEVMANHIINVFYEALIHSMIAGRMCDSVTSFDLNMFDQLNQWMNEKDEIRKKLMESNTASVNHLLGLRPPAPSKTESVLLKLLNEPLPSQNRIPQEVTPEHRTPQDQTPQSLPFQGTPQNQKFLNRTPLNRTPLIQTQQSHTPKDVPIMSDDGKIHSQEERKSTVPLNQLTPKPNPIKRKDHPTPLTFDISRMPSNVIFKANEERQSEGNENVQKTMEFFDRQKIMNPSSVTVPPTGPQTGSEPLNKTSEGKNVETVEEKTEVVPNDAIVSKDEEDVLDDSVIEGVKVEDPNDSESVETEYKAAVCPHSNPANYPLIFLKPEDYPKEPIDIAKLTDDVAKALSKIGVTAQNFGFCILKRAQATTSDLLKRPMKWENLQSHGKRPYIRMYKWLQQPDDVKLKMMEIGSTKANLLLGLVPPKSAHASKKVIKTDRFVFTREQKRELEFYFGENQYPKAVKFEEISKKMQLPITTIRNYFQNLRRNLKRTAVND